MSGAVMPVAMKQHDLAEWVARQRKFIGVSQGELATRIGISRTALWHLENHRRRISWDEGHALIGALEGLTRDHVSRAAKAVEMFNEASA